MKAKVTKYDAIRTIILSTYRRGSLDYALAFDLCHDLANLLTLSEIKWELARLVEGEIDAEFCIAGLVDMAIEKASERKAQELRDLYAKVKG